MKPLWLDEVITALISFGQSYQAVPLDTFFPLSTLSQVFAFQESSCTQITQTLVTESVHPPLFFCLLHRWLAWLLPWTDNWVWAMRSLPALLGVGAIAALYRLNRLAFSPAAGLMGAALMAVSPFAIYLSQEARHYTLPMLLITLALVGLVQIQQDLLSPRLRPWVWMGWSAVNMIGLYTHYFCLLALIAQVGALVGWLLWQRQRLSWHRGGAIALALGSITLSYLPWLPTLIDHFGRPETDWLIPYRPDWQDRIAPLYQTLVNWLLMVIALPVEDQPDDVVVGLGFIGLVFAIWFAWQVYQGFRQLWQQATQRPATVLLLSFTLGVLLQFFAIVYILDKDLTVVPRYSFVYYPGICALLGACLVQPRPPKRSPSSSPLPLPYRSIATVLLASLLSSLLVVQGLVFQKSYYPDRVAQNMGFEPNQPLLVAVTYESLQEVALGLSFALELRKRYSAEAVDAQVRYAFLDRSSGYSSVWQAFRQLKQPLPLPLNLWVVASPGMRTKDYPERLRINDPATPNRKAICIVDPEEFNRIGFPYQLFRCEPRARALDSSRREA
ncbi:MAG: hypothetical protein Kow00121_38080 [Elainellaceae cyanobacterium]